MFLCLEFVPFNNYRYTVLGFFIGFSDASSNGKDNKMALFIVQIAYREG